MSYTVMNPQPAARDPAASGIAAGLYPNEVAVTLDDGQDVAVYVEGSPTDNNAGLIFYASARAIAADGTTQLHGATQLVTEFQHTSNHDEVALYGADALAKCHILAVLGETITTVPIPNPAPAPAPQTQPMIPWDVTFLQNVSIRALVGASVAAAGITTTGCM